ncbi:hypothetical protein L3Y34_006199 [Caenorhabditis briggsae]|uniref:Uncharacterized protein n=1 Tax=Caenorhabditis briggsae TaxID=6238 RepID=A0AAE8ZW17_CAEBR|nr:hypothetical protein L3Y34_006199 [Caenorhabditis briggsae]
MTIMILLAFSFIGLVFGYDASKCTSSELPIAMKCNTKHKELRSQGVTLDLDDVKKYDKAQQNLRGFSRMFDTIQMWRNYKRCGEH